MRIAARLRLTPAETAELLLAAGFPPDDPAAGAAAFVTEPHPADEADQAADVDAGVAILPAADGEVTGTQSAPPPAGVLPLRKRGLRWLWATLALVAAGAVLLESAAHLAVAPARHRVDCAAAGVGGDDSAAQPDIRSRRRSKARRSLRWRPSSATPQTSYNSMWRGGLKRRWRW